MKALYPEPSVIPLPGSGPPFLEASLLFALILLLG